MRVQMTNSLGELAFVLWLAVTAATLLMLILKLLRGSIGRSSLILWAALLVSYPATWIVTSTLAPEQNLPAGTTECFDDWCVRVTGIRAVRTSAKAQAGHPYFVLSFIVSNEAGRVAFAPDHPQVVVIGRSGRVYAPSAGAQADLEMIAGKQPPLNSRLNPGEILPIDLAFETDAQDQPWKALVTEGTGPPIIGELNAAWPAKVFVLIEN